MENNRVGVYDFTTNWFKPYLPQWQRLVDDFGRKPENGLEIGCFEGRSAVWILENVYTHTNAKLTTIDTFEGSPEFTNGVEKNSIEINKMESRFRSNIAASGHGNKVEIIKGKSFETLVAWNNTKNNSNSEPQFDFVYIDASHEADSVLSDAVLVWPLLKYNGIVIFDDYALRRYAYDNAYVGIDGFVAAHELEIEVLEKNYQLAIKKVEKARTFTMVDWPTDLNFPIEAFCYFVFLQK